MFAAINEHKDVISTLMQREANLDLVDAVSIYVHRLYYKSRTSLL